MTLTMVLLTVGSAMMAPSRDALGARTPASETDEQSSTTAVYGLVRYSEGSTTTPLLGVSVLMPSFSEADDEDEGIAGSLAVGMMLMVWLVGLLRGGLVTVCEEPRGLRTLYEYTPLEQPG